MRFLGVALAGVVGAVVGGTYAFYALATMGIVDAIAFALILLPVVIVIVISGRRFRWDAMVKTLAATYILGFVAVWSSLLLAVGLRCQPPRCALATTPLEGALWGVGSLAIPIVPIGLGSLRSTLTR